MSTYTTPAGRAKTRLASEGDIFGREEAGTRAHYFTGRASRIHKNARNAFWIGLTLSVMGSITQAAAWLWMLAGGS